MRALLADCTHGLRQYRATPASTHIRRAATRARSTLRSPSGIVAQRWACVGVLPKFMMELEWGHQELTELRVVEDMRIRKHMMLSQSSGLVALPGGSGTLEELLEALTLKRLGIYVHPIVLVNTRDFFAPLITLLEHAVSERFMNPRHAEMWQMVDRPEEVPDALRSAPSWSESARDFATVL
jgi:uncharacterized protein (TIGR00730 family)